MNTLALYHDLKARGVILEALIEFKPILLKFLSWRIEEEPVRRTQARWVGPGLIRILDPFTGEWHEWPSSKCLYGVVAEADRRRKGGAG